MKSFTTRDNRRRIRTKIDALLEKMSLEEKVGQLNQLNGSEQTGPAVEDVDLEAEIRSGNVGSVLNVNGFEKRERLQRIAVEESPLGIPLLFGYDVIHGYRTISPIPLGEAASFDPEAVKEMSAAAAAETAADGVHWTFGPPVDVTRDARWGRSMETSGEDPYLASEFARARVEGFQGADLAAVDTVLACAKHYAGYGDVQAGREYNTAEISESTMRDFHLPPFKAAVDAGVGTLMNAFNVHDRIPAGASEHLVRDVLKEEWDFDGFVVSDWNSFREFLYHGVAADEREVAKLAIEAKSDVDMVGHIYSKELAGLVRDGVVDEALVDEATRRVLRPKFLLGLFDDPFKYHDPERRDATIRADDHVETARNLARKSTVLLKNEDDVLPLNASADVAVVGAIADTPDDVIGEWRAKGRPEDATSLVAGLRNALGEEHVTYAPGYERPGELTDELLTEAVETVVDADVAVVAIGETWQLSGEASSRADISLPDDQRALLKALVQTETPMVAVLSNGRPLAIPWLAEHVPSILETWFLGTEAGDAISDVLLGDSNPGGALPMSFPREVGQVPVQYNNLPTGRPQEHAEPGWGTSYIDLPNDPLYAFGHGLSYTTFDYGELDLDATEIGMDETLTVSVTVTNTGDRAGDEVVQLYVRDVAASRSRPVKELKGFQRVSLTPGEMRKVTFTLASDDLAFWTADEEMASEPGTFEVMVGCASDSIESEATFDLVE